MIPLRDHTMTLGTSCFRKLHSRFVIELLAHLLGDNRSHEHVSSETDVENLHVRAACMSSSPRCTHHCFVHVRCSANHVGGSEKARVADSGSRTAAIQDEGWSPEQDAGSVPNRTFLFHDGARDDIRAPLAPDSDGELVGYSAVRLAITRRVSETKSSLM